MIEAEEDLDLAQFFGFDYDTDTLLAVLKAMGEVEKDRAARGDCTCANCLVVELVDYAQSIRNAMVDEKPDNDAPYNPELALFRSWLQLTGTSHLSAETITRETGLGRCVWARFWLWLHVKI